MKYSSILLLSASLLSSTAFAGSNTEAAVGGALGGALGSVVGEHLGGTTGAAIGAGVGGAAGGAIGADKRSRTEAALGGGLGAAGGNVIGQRVGGSTGGLIGAVVPAVHWAMPMATMTTTIAMAAATANATVTVIRARATTSTSGTSITAEHQPPVEGRPALRCRPFFVSGQRLQCTAQTLGYRRRPVVGPAHEDMHETPGGTGFMLALAEDRQLVLHR